MAIAIVIVIIFVVAAVTIFLTASRRRATTGTLSRETRSRDQSVEVRFAMRAEHARIVPLCPFITRWIDNHPDYADLVDHELMARIEARA